MSLKKTVKWLCFSILGSIFFFYAVFWFYLSWNESKVQDQAYLDKSVYTRLKTPHQMILLNDGVHSLAKRLQLIESAQNSIELEFFIYELDFVAKLITQKLVEKAKEGVKVRLLVDFSLPVFKLRPIYAHFLKSKGIEVKYYNTAGIHQIFAAQHRTHRKLLLVDDQYAITGGRNIANDYFHLSETYNFLDADIYINGPIVKSLRESFDLYWNSEFAQFEKIRDDLSVEEIQKAHNFSIITKADKGIFEQVEVYQRQVLLNEKNYQCDDITFITDFPGVSEEKRRVFQTIKKVLFEAKESVIVESPYFVIRPDGLKLIEKLKEKDVELKVLRNGLYSTDAYYTVSALYPVLDNLEKTNIGLLAYDGDQPSSLLKLPITPSKRWGGAFKKSSDL